MITVKKQILLILGILACLCVSGQQVTREQMLKLFYQAQKAQKENQTEKAIEVYKQIITLVPQLPDPYLQLGNIYLSETTNIRSLEMAINLYNEYLRLKPDASKAAEVQSKISEAQTRYDTLVNQQTAETEDPKSIIMAVEAPSIIMDEVSDPELHQVEVVQLAPVIPNNKARSIPKNLTGRWASATISNNGREAWILDIKDMDNEYWISVNNLSAIRLTPIFKNIGNIDVEGKIQSDSLVFQLSIVSAYNQESKPGVMSTVGDFFGNMLGVDIFEWSIFSANKNKNTDKNLIYEYTFHVSPTPISLSGYVRTIVKEQKNPANILTQNIQDYELFRTPMNYTGIGYDPLAEEQKVKNKAFRELFAKTQKNAQTDIQAMNDLGCLLWSGIGTRPNMKKAVESFSAAARKNTHAMLNLATLYAEGLGVEKDMNKSREWYTAAIENGYTDAWVLRGDTYLQGDGPDPDYDKALACYMKALSDSSAYAAFRLGWIFQEGLGVQADEGKSQRYYQQAINQGYTEAMVEVGKMDKQRQNYQKALELFNQAAQKGNAQAMLQLSGMYLRGEGTEPDFTKAKEWEIKALKAQDQIIKGYTSIENPTIQNNQQSIR